MLSNAGASRRPEELEERRVHNNGQRLFHVLGYGQASMTLRLSHHYLLPAAGQSSEKEADCIKDSASFA